MLLPFGSAKLVVFPNPEFWAYAVLCINTVDAKVDISKTNASIDALKIGIDIFLGNCIIVQCICGIHDFLMLTIIILWI